MATGSYISSKSRYGLSDKSEERKDRRGSEGASGKDNNREIGEGFNPKENDEEGQLCEVGEVDVLGEVGDRISCGDDSEISKVSQ